jgi:hypothetical protein
MLVWRNCEALEYFENSEALSLERVLNFSERGSEE